MKIRTQFIISMALLGVLLLLTFVAVILTDRRVKYIDQQEALAAKVEGDAYDLSYLTNDYLVYRESQQASRWASKFNSFTNDLAQIQVNESVQQNLLTDIIKNQQQLSTVFAEIRAGIENRAQAQDPVLDADFLRVSWSRMEVQNQAIIFDVSRLRETLSEQDDRFRRLTSILGFTLLGLFGIFLLVNFWSIYGRTLKGIAGLQAGARIVGSGQLDLSIPVKSKDEIGELSQAFNQMAADLKQVTASKADLEKEILERKQVEAALRASEGEIQGHLEALRSANAELSQFNRTMVGRELRMIDLKKEVDELCRKAGQPERYYQSNEAAT